MYSFCWFCASIISMIKWKMISVGKLSYEIIKTTRKQPASNNDFHMKTSLATKCYFYILFCGSWLSCLYIHHIYKSQYLNLEFFQTSVCWRQILSYFTQKYYSFTKQWKESNLFLVQIQVWLTLNDSSRFVAWVFWNCTNTDSLELNIVNYSSVCAMLLYLSTIRFLLEN